eukprot:2825068-Prymnesium_polylepis.1
MARRSRAPHPLWSTPFCAAAARPRAAGGPDGGAARAAALARAADRHRRQRRHAADARQDPRGEHAQGASAETRDWRPRTAAKRERPHC